MKQNIFFLGLAALLGISLLAGCSGQETTTTETVIAVQKPVINFEGVVTSVDNGTVQLDNGKTIRITGETKFASDPDCGSTISKDIQVGSYIQGYTPDDADAGELTASNIWTNSPPSGGKIVVNFEGRVTEVTEGKVMLEDGRAVLIGDETSVTAPDGSAAEVTVGDYIQGYANNPDDSTINALSVLITAL